MSRLRTILGWVLVVRLRLRLRLLLLWLLLLLQLLLWLPLALAAGCGCWWWRQNIGGRMLENSCLLRPFARNAYKLLGRLPYYDIIFFLFKMCCGKTPQGCPAPFLRSGDIDLQEWLSSSNSSPLALEKPALGRNRFIE